MKKFISIFTFAFLVLWGAQSFSAVKLDYSLDVSQNYNFMRNDDLNNDGNNGIATFGDTAAGALIGTGMSDRGNRSGDNVNWFETLLGFNGSASVAGFGGSNASFNFRLVSQFDWMGAQINAERSNRPGSDSTAPIGATPTAPTQTGLSPFSLALNKANVKFDDFAGLPFNLTVGRQNIVIGNGFIFGNRMFGAGPTIYAAGLAPSGSAATTNGAIDGFNGQVTNARVGNMPLGSSSGGIMHAPEHGDYQGFDAVRADFSWKEFYLNAAYVLVDGGLSENISRSVTGFAVSTATRRNIASNDEEDAVVFNFGLNSKAQVKYPWNVEAYWIGNVDREPLSDKGTVGGTNTSGPDILILGTKVEQDEIYTTGLRGGVNLGSMGALQGLDLFAEYAIQYGVLGTELSVGQSGRDRVANAFNLGANFNFGGKYASTLKAEIVHFSGADQGSIESDNGVVNVTTEGTDWTAWDPVFRSKSWTLIMDYLDVFYMTDQLAPDSGGAVVSAGKVDAGFTNKNMLVLTGGLSPFNKLDAALTLAYAKFSEAPGAAVGSSTKNLGTEVDLGLVYKVSTDLRWTLDAGFFTPGSYYAMPFGGAAEAYKFQTGFKFSLL